MPSETIVIPDYSKLLVDLSSILKQGQQEAINSVNQIKLKTYWTMGQRMSEGSELSESSEASSIISQLATDLNLEPSLLYRIRQFYQLWPDGVPSPEQTNKLSWSHFVELLSITDGKERDFYLEEAVAKNWSRDNLSKAIQKDLYEASKSPKLKSANTLDRPDDAMHVYKAIVEKVVDGDTLLVRIDLGFDVWVNQRTRFRGINTEEMTERGVPIATVTERAEQAKAFVEDKLKDIPFVALKTYKTDIYGRYVSDIFYHPTISKMENVYEDGFFLNQQLLAAGLADLMD